MYYILVSFKSWYGAAWGWLVTVVM